MQLRNQDVVFWMIHPVLDRMTTAKRLSASTTIEFGSFGTLKPFQDESWLEYSYYTTNDYTCTGSHVFLTGVFSSMFHMIA